MTRQQTGNVRNRRFLTSADEVSTTSISIWAIIFCSIKGVYTIRIELKKHDLLVIVLSACDFCLEIKDYVT